jgi:hypothetical protein
MRLQGKAGSWSKLVWEGELVWVGESNMREVRSEEVVEMDLVSFLLADRFTAPLEPEEALSVEDCRS